MPALITSQRKFGPITVVDLRGGIDFGEGSLALRRTIRDLVKNGRVKVVLNLGGVNFINSAGIGELAGAYMPVKFRGGELKFLNPTKKVHGMLWMTQLDKVLQGPYGRTSGPP